MKNIPQTGTETQHDTSNSMSPYTPIPAVLVVTVITRSAQIFKKSRCYLQRFGSRRVTSSKYHAVDAQFWIDLQICYPVRSAWCKNCSNYAENTRCHPTEIGHSGHLAPRICAPLVIASLNLHFKNNPVVLFRLMFPVCCENHTKCIHTYIHTYRGGKVGNSEH